MHWAKQWYIFYSYNLNKKKEKNFNVFIYLIYVPNQIWNEAKIRPDQTSLVVTNDA